MFSSFIATTICSRISPYIRIGAQETLATVRDLPSSRNIFAQQSFLGRNYLAQLCPATRKSRDIVASEDDLDLILKNPTTK